MTATISKIKSHFVNWREWEMNPIVIKELRQGVRSMTVTGMLILFLIVLFLTSVGFLISQSFEVGVNTGLGGELFTTFTVILAIASMLFIPLYTGIRVATERQENNPDLLYVTTLSPVRIIWGKFLCSAYLVLLFFSACMPFMAFTNLLRGVDLPTVFYILFYLYLAVCAANMLAIFLACIPASRPFKILFALIGLILSFSVLMPTIFIAFQMMQSGVGAMMAQRDFWIGTLTAVLIGGASAGLLFFLSVALVSPPSANRALPVRTYLTAFWLLGGVLTLCWVGITHEADYLMVWTRVTLTLMIFALLVVISNSDQLSQRVRRTIPKAGWKRAGAFLFYNGAAGGLVWVAGILTITLLVTTGVAAHYSGIAASHATSRLGAPHYSTISTMPDDFDTSFMIMTAYALSYGLTALLIQRKFLPRRPSKLTGLLAVLLAGGWAIMPSIVLFFANKLSWTSVDGLQVGNVFNVYYNRDSSQLIYHKLFAACWLLLMVLLNAKWFFAQVRNFRPPESTVAEASTTAVPPISAP